MNSKQRRRFIKANDHVRLQMIVTLKMLDMPHRAQALKPTKATPKAMAACLQQALRYAKHLPRHDFVSAGEGSSVTWEPFDRKALDFAKRTWIDDIKTIITP